MAFKEEALEGLGIAVGLDAGNEGDTEALDIGDETRPFSKVGSS